MVQSAKGLQIDIILIHEDDIGRGECSFSLFFKQTPQVLIDPPHELFRENGDYIVFDTRVSQSEYVYCMHKIIDRIFDSDSWDEDCAGSSKVIVLPFFVDCSN